ncbi:MAG: cytochrome c maturation protein CcmE [Halocynthiibacter sp.]
MNSLKKKRRIQVVLVAFVALTLSTALIGYALKDGINYFRSPAEVVASPPPPSETFRLGGLVEEGSLVRNESETITFKVTDGGGTVAVSYTGILPDLFDEGQGMIGTGQMKNGVFVASEILAKHDESYMPKEVVDALKEQGVYQPEAASSTDN